MRTYYTMHEKQTVDFVRSQVKWEDKVDGKAAYKYPFGLNHTILFSGHLQNEAITKKKYNADGLID